MRVSHNANADLAVRVLVGVGLLLVVAAVMAEAMRRKATAVPSTSLRYAQDDSFGGELRMTN